MRVAIALTLSLGGLLLVGCPSPKKTAAAKTAAAKTDAGKTAPAKTMAAKTGAPAKAPDELAKLPRVTYYAFNG